MTLHINGEPRDFPDGLTLADLIAQLGMKPDRIAVELNLEIVPRGSWEITKLKHGDRLEIVHFVGGGSEGAHFPAPATQGDSPVPELDWNCPGCGLINGGNFCCNCGEKKPSVHDLSLVHLLSHAGETLFHWDSKIFRSFWLLFSKPGFLAAEFVRGNRKSYIRPIQLFFIANLVYFFLQPVTGWTGLRTTLYVHTHMMQYSTLASSMVEHRLAKEGITEAEFARSFNHAVDVEARSLVIAMVPLGAVLLGILEWRKRRQLAEHFIVALHIYAFWLLCIFLLLYGSASGVILVFQHYGIRLKDTVVDSALAPVATLIMTVYVYATIRRFYRDGRIMAAIKGLIVAEGIFYIVVLYRFMLFLTAFYSA